MRFGEWLRRDLQRSREWYRSKLESRGCLVQLVLVYALFSPFLCICSVPVAIALRDSLPTPGFSPGREPVERDTWASPYPTYTPYPTCTPLPTPTQSPLPSLTPTRSMGSRQLPVPLGEPFVWHGEDRKVEIAIDRVVFGDEAIRMVREANRFNDPPDVGRGFVVIHARARYISGIQSESWGMDEFDFVMVSDNLVLRPPSIVDPEPEFEWKGFPGAEVEGWMTFSMLAQDPSPLLVYKPELGTDVSEGVWFALR